MPVLIKLLNVTACSLKTTLNHVSCRAIHTTSPVSWISQKLGVYHSLKGKEAKYKEKDRAPPNSSLIYRAPMDGYVIWSMHVSTATATLISSAALYQYACNKPILDTEYANLVLHSEDIYYFALGFVAINAVLRYVVSRFTQRIYKDNGKYLAVFHPQLPGGLSHHTFNKGEVKEVNHIFNPWNQASYKLGTKRTLLFLDYFKTPSEFHEMSTKNESSQEGSINE